MNDVTELFESPQGLNVRQFPGAGWRRGLRKAIHFFLSFDFKTTYDAGNARGRLEPRDIADRAWHAGPNYRDVAPLFDQARERLCGRAWLPSVRSSSSL